MENQTRLPEPKMIITQLYHWHALNNCMPLCNFNSHHGNYSLQLCSNCQNHLHIGGCCQHQPYKIFYHRKQRQHKYSALTTRGIVENQNKLCHPGKRITKTEKINSSSIGLMVSQKLSCQIEHEVQVQVYNQGAILLVYWILFRCNPNYIQSSVKKHLKQKMLYQQRRAMRIMIDYLTACSFPGIQGVRK